jgi:integrase
VRRSLVVTAMVCDFAGLAENPARDKRHVRLPRSEADEMTPPTAEAVEAAAHRLITPYLIGLLVLDATGCRLVELEAATIGDLDEDRRAWLVRKAVSKTARARWIEVPDDLFAVVVDRLPAREDRDLDAPLFGVGAARLRTAIGRACRDAGVPCSRRTTYATEGSASSTGRAWIGRRSAPGWGSARSL